MGALYVVSLFMMVNIHAQAHAERSVFIEQEIEKRPFDEQEWKRQISGLDYYEKTDTSRSQQVKPLDLSAPVQSRGLMILILLAVGGLLAFLLYKIIGRNLNTKLPPDKKIIYETAIPDEHTKLEDLEKRLKECLANGQFNQAVRLYYLILLRTMADGGFISIRREKTNREYLREIENEERKRSFAEATRIFEAVWYGKQPVEENEFDEIRDRYHLFLNRLNIKSIS